MKKLGLLLVGGGLLLSLATLPSTNSDSYLGTAEALFGTQEALSVRRAVGEGEVKTSRTYSQNGEHEGRRCLRFATAVYGDFSSLAYYVKVDGVDQDFVKEEVNVVYKGISAGEGVSYYNGTTVVDTESELTNDWYWACYTISFKDETHWNTKIDAYLEATPSESETPVVSEQKSNSLNESRVEDGSLALPSSFKGTWKEEVSGSVLTLSFSGNNAVVEHGKEKYTLTVHDKLDEETFLFKDASGNHLKVEDYFGELRLEGKLGTAEFSRQLIQEYVPMDYLELSTKEEEFVIGVDKGFGVYLDYNSDATGYGVFDFTVYAWLLDDWGDNTYMEASFIEYQGFYDNSEVPYLWFNILDNGEEGSVVIDVETADGQYTSTNTLTFAKKKNVESVTLDESEVSLEVGDTHTIEATVAPSDAAKKDLKYALAEDSDQDVVEVSSKGVVTALKEGEATVVVTATNGTDYDKSDDKTATLKVTVTASTSKIHASFGGEYVGEYMNDELTIDAAKGEATLTFSCFDADFNYVSASVCFSWVSGTEETDEIVFTGQDEDGNSYTLKVSQDASYLRVSLLDSYDSFLTHFETYEEYDRLPFNKVS